MGTPIELSAARFRAASERPYLATAIMSMIPIETKGLGTLACDRWWRLYYDPAILTEWSVQDLSSVVIHEVGHLIRNHMERFERLGVQNFYGSQLANVAGDMEINDDLKAEGLTLPGTPALPSQINMPDGLLCEQYYTELVKQNPQAMSQSGMCQSGTGQGQKSGQSQPGQQGNNKGNSSTWGRQGQSGQKGNNQQGKGSGSTPGKLPDDFQTGLGSGQCGSCASGVQQPWELGPPDGGASGDPDRQSGIHSMEGELIRRKVAQEILEHSKSRGTIPAGWKRWAELHMKPKIDWRKQLGTIIRSTMATISGAVDYSRSRPNRRQHAMGKVILPALRQPTPNVAVVIDTSGSMDDARINAAMSEIQGILSQIGQKDGLNVLSCDSAVHTAKRVFNMKQVKPLGGGGTDMRIGIDAALKSKPRPDCIICLTDGYTPWHDKPIGTKLVVCMVGTKEKGPPYAKTIYIEEKDVINV